MFGGENLKGGHESRKLESNVPSNTLSLSTAAHWEYVFQLFISLVATAIAAITCYLFMRSPFALSENYAAAYEY